MRRSNNTTDPCTNDGNTFAVKRHVQDDTVQSPTFLRVIDW
jgi:hypothetical protein